MATSSLRDDSFLLGPTTTRAPLLGNDTGYMTGVEKAAYDAAGGNALTNGFAGARIGTRAMNLLAEEASLRAAGDPASMLRAEQLRPEIVDLQAQSQQYNTAPQTYEEVLEQGLSAVPGYVAGKIGGAFGSSVDSIATGAALGTLGTGLSAIPNPITKLAGQGLRWAAPAEMYRQNVQTMKGEGYGAMREDPTIMAEKSAQEINNAALGQGVIAGALDTVLPGHIVGSLTGRALKESLKGATKKGAARTLAADAGIEGLTETAQQATQIGALEYLNPDRDGSGDVSDLINAGIGGVIGGAGLGAPHALVDAGFHRLGVKGEGVKGEDVDLKTGRTVEEDLKGSGVDFTAQRDAALKRREVLTGGGEPPEGMDALAEEEFLAGGGERRKQAILEELAKSNNPRAAQIAKEISAVDTSDAMSAWDPAFDKAMPLIDQGPYGPSALAKLAASAAKRRGMKNEEEDSAADAWMKTSVASSDLGAKVGGGGTAELPRTDMTRAQSVAAAKKAMQDDHESRSSLSAKILWSEFRKAAEATGHAVNGSTRALIMDHGHEIAAMASEGLRTEATPAEMARAQELGRQVASVLGARTKATLDGLATVNAADQSPVFKAMYEKAVDFAAAGKSVYEKVQLDRDVAVQGLMKLVPAEAHAKLLASGVNLATDEGAQHQLLDVLEKHAAGEGHPLTKLQAMFGKEATQKMLELAAPGRLEPRLSDKMLEEEYGVDESDTAELTSDDQGNESDESFVKALAEKSLSKIEPSAHIIHHGTRNLRSVADIFKRSGQGLLPKLLRTKDLKNDFGGDSDAVKTLGGRMREVLNSTTRKKLGASKQDLENQSMDGDSYDVNTVSVKDLMDRTGMSDDARHELMLQYMEQEADGKAPDVKGKLESVRDLRFLQKQKQHQILSDMVGNRESLSPSGKKQGKLDGVRDLRFLQRQHQILSDMVGNRESLSPSGKKLTIREKATLKQSTFNDMERLLDMLTPAQQERLQAITDPTANSIARAKIVKVLMERKQAEVGDYVGEANKFFADRHVVLAEQKTDRDYLRITLAELEPMIEKGRELFHLGDKARKETKGTAKMKQDAADRAIAEAGLINFETPLNGGKTVHIPINMLVKWVQTMRDAHTADTKVKATEAKTDRMRNTPKGVRSNLLEGMAALYAQNIIDPKSPPYVLNAKGGKEFFKPKFEGPANEGEVVSWSGELPPSLDFGGVTQKQLADRADGAAKRVQAKADALAADQSAQVDAFNESQKDAELSAELSADAVDTQSAEMVRQAELMASGSEKDKDQRESHERERKIFGGAESGTFDILNKGNAYFRAGSVADRLWMSIGKGKDGLARVMAVIRALDRPTSAYDEDGNFLPTQMVGGSFYVAPLAALVTPQRIALIERDMPQHAAFFKALRGKVADQLLKMMEPTEANPYGEISTGNLGKMVDLLSGHKDGAERIVSKKRASFLAELAAPYRAVAAKRESKVADATALATGPMQGSSNNLSQTVGPADDRAAVSAAQERAKATAFNEAQPIEKFTGEDDMPGNGGSAGDSSRRVSTAVKKADTSVRDVEREQAEARERAAAPGLGVARTSGQVASERAEAVKSGKFNLEDDSVIDEILAKQEQNLKAKMGTAADPAAVDTPTALAVSSAKAYITRTLGPQIKTYFEKAFPGYKGKWDEVAQAIHIATANPQKIMQLAYHESLHGFYSNILKGMPEVKEMLERVLADPKITERLEAYLKGSPKAIEAMRADPEERVAYAYQFWKADMLDLGREPQTFFEKVQRFMRVVFNAVREDEKALAIFTAFDRGDLREVSPAGKAITKIMESGQWRQKFMERFDKQAEWLKTMALPAHDTLADSESATLRAIAKMWWSNPADAADGSHTGVIDERKRKGHQYNNYFKDAIKGLNQQEMKELSHALNSGEVPLTKTVRDAQQAIFKLNDHFREYITKAGVKIGMRDQGSYFPVVFDLEKMIEKKAEFVEMLMTHYPDTLKAARGAIAKANGDGKEVTIEDVANAFHQAIVDRSGVTEEGMEAHREDGILNPYFASQNKRSFDWISKEHRTPFLNEDVVATMTRYLSQGVRSAEYVRQFGEGGHLLQEMMARAGDRGVFVAGDAGSRKLDADGKFTEDGPVLKELKAEAEKLGLKDAKATEWVERRYKDAQDAMGAMEGTLGKNISAGLRQVNSTFMVYQGIRLLPLSLFSAMLDPNGLRIAGGDFDDFLSAYKRGASMVWGTWKDALLGNQIGAGQMDMETAQAAMVGTIDSTMELEGMGAAHTSEYTAGPARRINRGLFLANGLTAWDRAMRVSATSAAMKFIVRHDGNADPVHSARWLKGLGLKPGDVTIKDGRLVIDPRELATLRAQEKGSKIVLASEMEQARMDIEQTHIAINRWVDRAILTPNSAQRPAWASDPHYQMFFHLKQYTYSFQKTSMKYAQDELAAGHGGALTAMMAGVPIMIASDMTRAFITGGGQLPGYMANWTMADWVAHAWARSGNNGIAQIGLDALDHPASLFGPTVSQAVDAIFEPVGETLKSAIPVVNQAKFIGPLGV